MPATMFLVFLLLGPPIGFAAFAIEMNYAQIGFECAI
ncbi:hypothetical protein Y590_17970 [Methylobacterium sp. AMS5]|nr:hypothetical protein Y590_17970 [Methylobacterium sp. AMS5]